MPPVASLSVARRLTTSIAGDALLGVVALAVFVGALAFQRGVPAARAVNARTVAEAPRLPARTTMYGRRCT